MELTFLGTSAGAPTKERNVSGVALRDGGRWDLFDCGEATQHQLLHTPLSLARLERVFISHLHGDHCFGLFGLLGSRSMTGAEGRPLTVFGPTGLEAMVRTVLEASATHLTYPITFVEVGETGGRVVDDERGTIDALPLSHRVPSLAWSIVEADRPGVFDVETAMALGVAEGPDFGRLRRGETVEVPGGTVRPEQVVGPPRTGRRIVIAGDNRDPDSLFGRTGAADLAVHEATFVEADLERLPDDRGHSTAARVATAAAAHKVRNLVLTHISPRHGDTTALEAEARAQYAGGLHLAADFDVIELPRDGGHVDIRRDRSAHGNP